MTSTTSGPPTISRTTVTFPRRQWASRDSCLTLALTATAQLVWPPSCSTPDVFLATTVPAARVAQLVRAGRLWIGTDGRRVQLGIRAALAGKRTRTRRIQGEPLARLQALFAGWAWGELGLVVAAAAAADHDAMAIGHPPSPNGLYAPSSSSGIAQARFERVDCELRFSCCLVGFDLPTVVPTPAPPPSPPLSRGRVKGNAKTKKNKKNKKPKPKLKQPVRTSTDPGCLFDDSSWARTRTLVEAALATFVGIQGRQVGVRALDRQSLPGGAPSLLDVAPAVWSHHLFQAAAARARHVPLIHRALSAFTNAQSPRLRRKAEALTRVSSLTADQATDRGGLRSLLEEVLLKHTLFEPQRIKRPVRLATLPTPEPTTASSSQEQRQECDVPGDTEESTFYDLDMDNIDHAFALSQPSTDDSACDVYAADESEAGEAVDWDDIEAWTEYDNEWPDLENEWLDNEIDDEEDWLDVEDEQLEAALSTFACDAESWCEDDQFMPVDEMDLYTLGIADEGVSMWQSEQDMIAQIL